MSGKHLKRLDKSYPFFHTVLPLTSPNFHMVIPLVLSIRTLSDAI